MHPKTEPRLPKSRRFPRFPAPVFVAVIAPSLSELPITPEDICANGLQLIVPKEPVPDQDVECSIRIPDGEFKGVSATPVWIRTNESNPPTWALGLRFELPEEEREQLEKSLKKNLRKTLR